MARRTSRIDRGQTRQQQKQSTYRQLRNPFRPVEILDADAIENIHDCSMRILETIGIRVLDPESRSILSAGGFNVDESENIVKFDRASVMELVALAPSKATIRGRDPAKRVQIGEGYLAFAAVGGPPFVSDLQRGRRAGNYDDMCDFMRLVQMLDILHIDGGCSIEPTDLPVETRHLDFYLACCRYLDKPLKALTIGKSRVQDAIEILKILHGKNEDQLAADPVVLANTNTNTPLVLDEEVAQGAITWARAGQVMCVTPFALAGAMAPVTLAGALALQNAETLAACALIQLVNPGCPYVYGTFVSNVDMKSGSPAFGTPEYTLAAQASGQMARRYNLPWRSSNVNASNAPDAQSAYESQMSLWGAVTGHVGVLNQCAGWLEGGLVASFEKLIIDAEMLQMMAAWMDGIEVSADTLGFDAIADVGHGGHFFGTAHTLERYENAFYQPLVSDWSNFENWSDKGSKDTAVRAHDTWKSMLAEYQAPELDTAVCEELEAFVERRKQELART